MRQDKAVVFGKALGAIAMGVLLGLVSLAFCSTAAAQIVGSVSLNVERAGHSATWLGDGRILIAGGENAGGALSAAELYDPVTQRFALTGSLVVPRAEHTATVLADGRVLITGGRHGAAPPSAANPTATTPLASTEVFDPDGACGVFRLGHDRFAYFMIPILSEIGFLRADLPTPHLVHITLSARSCSCWTSFRQLRNSTAR